MAGYGRDQVKGLPDLGGVAVADAAGVTVAEVGAGHVSVVFAGLGGSRCREPLERCWDVRFEDAPPVRSFPSRPGQRHFPGLWWAATTGDHVGYESWLERDQVMVLDFDPEMVAFSSQPFQLVFGAAGGRVLRHTPDFFARRRDGSAVVIDVRADDRIGPKDAALFAATEGVCASVGWAYRRVGELGPVFAANLRWLAGYRHPRCLRSDVAARVCEVFAAPAALLPGARAAGDPVAVLPVLFHLLWSHVLAADLAGSRLSSSSVVAVAGGMP